MPLIDHTDAIQTWRGSKDEGTFKGLVREGKLVPNCSLPQSISGFVEGEHLNTLHKALDQQQLRPIATMGAGIVRDVGKTGAYYVYFRVMYGGETPATMAFNSVGSSLQEYKVRMQFSPRIWTNSSGGYVNTMDGMGQVNTTPFSQTAQRKALHVIHTLGRTTRGSAEVGIYGSVSMSDLESVWCLFPYSKQKLDETIAGRSALPTLQLKPGNLQSKPANRQPRPPLFPPSKTRAPRYYVTQAPAAKAGALAPPVQPQQRTASPLDTAVRNYQALLPCFGKVQDMGSAGANGLRWICFSNYIPGRHPNPL